MLRSKNLEEYRFLDNSQFDAYDYGSFKLRFSNWWSTNGKVVSTVLSLLRVYCKQPVQ